MDSTEQNRLSGVRHALRMLRHFLRPVRVLLVVSTGLILLLGAAAWRLYEHELPLDFLTARLEQALDSRLQEQKTTIDSIRLAWDRETATLLLHLRDTRIASVTGEPIAHIPDLLLGIDPWELLRRRIRLTQAVLVGGFVDIVRKADGSIDFDVAPGESNESPLHFSRLSREPRHEDPIDGSSFPFANLLRSATEGTSQANGIFSELEQLEVRDGELSFLDQESGVSLSMDDLSLRMQRFRDSMNWNIETQIENDKHRWRLTLSVQQEFASMHSDIALHVEDLVPARLAPLAALSSTSLPLRFLNLPVKGSATLRVADDGALLNAGIEMALGEGDVVLPDIVSQNKSSDEISIPVNFGRIAARFDSANSEVILDEVLLLSEQKHVFLSGSIGFNSTDLPWLDPNRVEQYGLGDFEIRNAELLFLDQESGVSLSMNDLSLRMQRFQDSMNWNIKTQIESDEHRWGLTLSVQRELASMRSEIALQVEDFVPARLAPLAALSSTSLPLRFLNLPLQGSASLHVGDDGALLNAGIEMALGEGDVVLPDLVSQDESSGEVSIPVNSGRIAARLDSANSQVILDEVLLLAEQNHIALSGSIGFDSAGLSWRRPYRVELQGEDMMVHLDGITQSLLPLRKMSLRADVNLDGEDLSDAELAIEELQLVLPTQSETVNIYGSIHAAPGSPEFRLSITAADLSKEELMALWPVPLAADTRAWVKEYVWAARLENVLIRLDMAGGVMAAVMEENKPFPKDSLIIETDLHELAIDYFPPLPPLLNGRGGLRISDNRLSVWADTARVVPAPDLPGIQVENARFSIEDFYREDPLSNTGLSFRGEAGALLALLQGVATNPRQGDEGIETLQGEGIIAGDLSLSTPLYEVTATEQIDLAVNASGSDLAFSVSEGKYRLAEADIDFTGSLQGIGAKGHAKVNGVPVRMDLQGSFLHNRDSTVAIDLEGEFNQEELANLGVSPPFIFEGRIPAKLELRGERGGVDEGQLHVDLTPMHLPEGFLNWNKAEEQSASLEMQLNFPDEGDLEISDFLLRGEDIEVRGNLRFDEQNRLQMANFPVIRIGTDTSLSARARKEASGELVLDVRGTSLDMRDTINNLLGGEGLVGDEGEDVSGEVITHGRIDRLLAHEDIALEGGEFFLHQSGNHIAELVLDARLNETDFHMRMEPDSEGSRIRKLSVVSGDGGALLKGLNLYPHMVGGELKIEADVSPIGVPLQMHGKISGGRFHVVNAPALAQLLSLVSLTGIAELLSQNGILFQKLELPFEMDTQEIRLLKGDLSGLSLGLSLRGNIERANRQVELHGVLIPSYGLVPSSILNSLLGSIPLLGELMVSRPGEGILGVTFLISGHVDDVSVTANPLSLLTPGIFRRLTEFGSSPSRADSEEGGHEPP